MKNRTEQPRFPRVTVGALILNNHGEVLLLKAHKWNGLYGLPAGKVKFGEDLQTALRREVREETGLDIFEIRLLMVQEIVQSQEFFEDSHFVSINSLCKTHSHDVVLNHEAQEYIWSNPINALDLSLNQPTRKLLEKYLEEKDKIIIQDLNVECIVGIAPAERKQKQKVLITVEIHTNRGRAAIRQNIAETLDYSVIANRIKDLVIEGEYYLLETMAEEIAHQILKEKVAQKVRVLIKKPKALKNAAFPAVEIERFASL